MEKTTHCFVCKMEKPMPEPKALIGLLTWNQPAGNGNEWSGAPPCSRYWKPLALINVNGCNECVVARLEKKYKRWKIAVIALSLTIVTCVILMFTLNANFLLGALFSLPILAILLFSTSDISGFRSALKKAKKTDASPNDDEIRKLWFRAIFNDRVIAREHVLALPDEHAELTDLSLDELSKKPEGHAGDYGYILVELSDLPTLNEQYPAPLGQNNLSETITTVWAMFARALQNHDGADAPNRSEA